MSQDLIFNGINIDREIKNYRTINVEGRQLAKDEKDKRIIIVHFLMKARKHGEFLESIRRLNEIILTDEDVKFQFNDEVGHRIGKVIEVEDPAYDSHVGIGKFKIEADPFLYRNFKISTGAFPRFKFRKYPVKIDRISATTEIGNKVIVRNVTTGRKIILNGDFKSGDKLEITKNTITINGENKLMWLDYAESDYHEFKIYSENEVIIEGGKDLEIEYWECIL